MGWRDRDYNRGGDTARAFFANPGSILGMSIPCGTFPGFSIRLHFWLLLQWLFSAIAVFRMGLPAYYIPMGMALSFVILVLHELGHRFCARRVGGDHNTFVLWPLGGMVAPQAPPRPWATFMANIGGILVTLPIGAAAAILAYTLPHTNVQWSPVPSPFAPLFFQALYLGPATSGLIAPAYYLLSATVTMCAAIVVINLFPAYWFDGGNIWQSILWPKFGLYRAIRTTCIAGMVLSVPFFLLSLYSSDLMGVFIWALIFSGCYVRNRDTAAAGPAAVVEGLDEYSGSWDNEGARARPTSRRRSKSWFRAAARKAAKERAEQSRIDAILDKVHERGLHSLTWGEKRALRKATARQRQQDLVEKS